MCTRTIFVKVFARTAPQAAALPVTALGSPDISLLYKGQFKWTGDCIEQPRDLLVA